MIEILIVATWYVWMATFTWRELYYTSDYDHDIINCFTMAALWPCWALLEVTLGWIGYIINPRSFFTV